jgi:hypothetical protein
MLRNDHRQAIQFIKIAEHDGKRFQPASGGRNADNSKSRRWRSLWFIQRAATS